MVRTGSWSESKRKCEEKVEALIGDARGKYEKNYLMMLLQMYEFPEGVAHLSQILRISQELLNHFYSKGDWDAIIGLCKEFGRREPDIWVQTLKYLAKFDDPRTAGYLTTVLSDLSRLETLPVPPLVILSMLKKNRHITFEVVKAFFAGYIKKAIDSRVADTAALEKNLEKSSGMRGEIEKLQSLPIKFTNSKCSLCEMKLSTPSLHFLCTHSFHTFCLSDTATECVICTPESRTVMNAHEELMKQREDQGTFFKALESTGDRFEVVTQYFARGIIPSA
jgi:hypothetical protein